MVKNIFALVWREGRQSSDVCHPAGPRSELLHRQDFSLSRIDVDGNYFSRLIKTTLP
jgi:hypothetical protein